ncbi:MAG: hypothetical protein ACK5ZG_13470 [Phycisphaerae bacterium]|jgi:hypothetical protein
MHQTFDLTVLINSPQALSVETWNKLLKRYKSELRSTGILTRASVNFDRLYECVIAAPDSLPPQLLTELAVIADLATSDEHRRLLAVLSHARRKLPFPIDGTCGDLAAMLVIEDFDAAQRLVIELQPVRRRRTYCFHPLSGPTATFSIKDSNLRSLQDDFDRLAKKSCRITGTRVLATPTEHGFRLHIDRSDVVHRTTVCQSAFPTRQTMQYMPVQNDVVVYDTRFSHLFVQCARPSDVRDVTRLVGAAIFNSEYMFVSQTPPQFFSAAPLLQQGSRCVQCRDIAGLSDVSATRLDWFRRSHAADEHHVYSSSGLENEFAGMLSHLQRDAVPSRLDFRFTLSTGEQRVVRLQMPNIIVLLNDDVGEVALSFLRNRRFVNERKDAIHELNLPLLGTA